MTDDSKQNSSARRSPGAQSVLAFALAVLAVAGCLVGSRIIEWVEKLPVPWPEAVVVDDEFRNLSMPDRIGPYRAVQEGEYGFQKPEQPDGPDNIFKSDDLVALGIGYPIDKDRYPERQSNWYASRYYIDTREDTKAITRIWRLDIYYYTGSRDPAPHVGENCIVAAGGTIIPGKSKVVSFSPWPLREGWNEGVSFKRLFAVRTDHQNMEYETVEYYVFAVNDRPMTGRLNVKKFLNDPFVTYSYFAKVQFVPLLRGRAAENLEAVDNAAEEFASNIMPVALEMLPTREDIQRLGEKSKE